MQTIQYVHRKLVLAGSPDLQVYDETQLALCLGIQLLQIANCLLNNIERWTEAGRGLILIEGCVPHRQLCLERLNACLRGVGPSQELRPQIGGLLLLGSPVILFFAQFQRTGSGGQKFIRLLLSGLQFLVPFVQRRLRRLKLLSRGQLIGDVPHHALQIFRARRHLGKGYCSRGCRCRSRRRSGSGRSNRRLLACSEKRLHGRRLSNCDRAETQQQKYTRSNSPGFVDRRSMTG